jgi:hypothetical protein
MRMINKTFIAGMLAMALVFGMTGCPQGTTTETKTVYVPGGGGGSDRIVEVEGVSFASNEKALLGYLDKGDSRKGPVYIVDDLTIENDLIIPEDKPIVITNDAAICAKAVEEGVKIKEGDSQNRGVLFNITEPGDTTPTLTVKGTLVVRSKVTLGSATNSTQSGKLTIGNSGRVVVASGATVTTTTSSQIQLVTATSTLVFEDTGAKLNVVGTIESGETVVGQNTGSALIVVPSESPDLTIAAENVTIGGQPATEITADGASSIIGSSAAASTPSAVSDALSGGAEEVFYSGEAANSRESVIEGEKAVQSDNEKSKG